jgi:hypothetical protein
MWQRFKRQRARDLSRMSASISAFSSMGVFRARL